MQTALLICEFNRGMGHVARMSAIAAALSRRFHVTLVVLTAESHAFQAPPRVDLRVIQRSEVPVIREATQALAALKAIAEQISPTAILVEYFPFGRHAAIFYLLPFFEWIRKLSPHVALLSSVRDILDKQLEAFHASSIVKLANDHFDAILVHSDPRLVRLDETFESLSEITIPIYYTNYVGQPASHAPSVRKPIIVVSAGGGCGGEALLKCALIASKNVQLKGYRFKAIAGRFIRQDDWNELEALCADAGERVELVRWVPDLVNELKTAAVSVSRCGYNTSQDILLSRAPALVVPYATEELDEQMQRGEILSRVGAVRMLTEDKLTPETLAEEIVLTAKFTPSSIPARLDGAERTCDYVSELVERRRVLSGVSVL